MNYTAIFIIVLVLLAFLGLFVVPRFMLKRAMSRVIRSFRDKHAINPRDAKTLEELGLKPRSFMEGMFRTRDYRPYAMDVLRRAEIIQVTEEGRLYLSEERLSASELSRRL